MIYGLIGASGSGKTTLAKAVAETLDVAYVPSSITESARRHGFDAVGALSLPDRVKLQFHLLEDHLELIDKAPRPMITDRTPIDMVAYLLAEFDMHSHDTFEANDDTLHEVERYSFLGRQTTVFHYDHVFMLGRLMHYEADAKRPAVNPAYHRHTELIMKGLLAEVGTGCGYSILATERLDFRQDYVCEVISTRLDQHEEHRASCKALN